MRRAPGAALAAALAFAPLTGCLGPVPFQEEAWRAQVEATRAKDLYAPHRDADGVFFNPWLQQERGSFWRWRFSRSSRPDPEGRAPRPAAVPNDGAYLADPAAPPLVTHVGHATFAVQLGGPVVVTDPFFSDGIFYISRETPPPFGPEKIPDGSVVLISHNHYDHLDSDSVKALAPRTRFLVPLGLGGFVRERGGQSVRELDWWETAEIDGTRFTFVPMQHWSRRLGQSYNETLWGGWLIERGPRRVLFAGDSGYFKGFREIGQKFPGIDVALLPVGAYEPRWFMHYAHVDIPEVLRALEDLGAKTMVPTQWGVVKLGDGPSTWPLVDLETALATTHARLRNRVAVLPIGGRLPL